MSLNECPHPVKRIAGKRCLDCGEFLNIAGATAPPRCCAICAADETPDNPLEAAGDKKLECLRCRDEHPRSGRYEFNDGSRRPSGSRTGSKGVFG